MQNKQHIPHSIEQHDTQGHTTTVKRLCRAIRNPVVPHRRPVMVHAPGQRHSQSGGHGFPCLLPQLWQPPTVHAQNTMAPRPFAGRCPSMDSLRSLRPVAAGWRQPLLLPPIHCWPDAPLPVRLPWSAVRPRNAGQLRCPPRKHRPRGRRSHQFLLRHTWRQRCGAARYPVGMQTALHVPAVDGAQRLARRPRPMG